MSDSPLPCRDGPHGDSGRPSAQGDKSYPNRLPIANSDDAPQSPWFKKLVLSLDGGGVRGYSSLLVLRRLLCIIADLESGNRNDLLEADEIQDWIPNHSSAEYPWRNPPEEANIVARGQDPEKLGYSDACSGVEPDTSAVSSQEERPRDGEAVRNLGPTLRPPSHNSGAGSRSSNTSSGNTPAQEEDSWKIDTLVKFRIHHYFDYVVGTSTGGLSALMLSRLGMDIDDALRQYATVGNGVFAHRRRQVQRWGGIMRPKYASANMNKALQTVVEHGSKKETARREIPSHEIRLLNTRELKSCRTAVIAYGGPSNTSENTYVFRNYDRPRRPVNADKETSWLFNTGDASIARVWEVARATSAAPCYFSKHTIDNGTSGTYIDGGMGCNNPADLMRQEVEGIHGRSPELILSIGTGKKAPQQVNTRQHRFFNNARSVFHTVKKLPDIVTESEECHTRLQTYVKGLRRERSRDSSIPSNYPMYHRFNVPGLGTIELDAWESTDGSKNPDGGKTLQELKAQTRTYLNSPEVKKRMEACAKELVLTRRKRAKTERWEQFATHTTYHCPLEEENQCEDKLFFTREQLRSHAAECHQFVPWISVQERPSSPDNECPEDSPICIMDQCAEAPQLFRDANAVDEMLQHLQGPAHNMKNPEPKWKQGLEKYLDDGRRTRDAAFQEEAPLASTEQPDSAQQPPEGQNAGVNRSRWATMVRLGRRKFSSKVDSQSTGQSASNITESSRERNGGEEPPSRQEGDATRQTDNNTTDSQRRQGVSPPAEQMTCAESSRSPIGEAEGHRDGIVSTPQQQQPQHRQPQASNPCVDRSAGPEPSNPRIDHAADRQNCNTTGSLQNQARRPSVQQHAGAEQFSEHNGNAELPVDREEVDSNGSPVSGGMLPSLDHATKHIFTPRVQST